MYTVIISQRAIYKSKLPNAFSTSLKIWSIKILKSFLVIENHFKLIVILINSIKFKGYSYIRLIL
jgi:hypothetical protein